MVCIRVNPANITRKSKKLTAGDRLIVKKGIYDKPVVFNGLAGTWNNPILIEAEKGAIFTSGLSLFEYTKRANLIAQRRQAAGYYPSVGQTADEAALVFLHCKHIIVRKFTFVRCWPTALYLDECQHITLSRIRFREGTIAIGANGSTTRDLKITRCKWKQDVSADHAMWNRIPWSAIHGSKDNTGRPGVDLQADYRAWDGDFFRAWDIAGNITIRKNRISDAFNAIHFFNRVDRLAPGVDPNSLEFNDGKRASANVLIEKNRFKRIRDNVIEPENHAWNWVIRHNILADCYRPFSFELDRAGWFYVYGNYGWVNNPPASNSDGHRRKCSHFKLGGAQHNEGKIYVFNNSWFYRSGKGIFPNGILKKLRHFNNAIGYGHPPKARMFGKTADLGCTTLPFSAAETDKDIAGHFTRKWQPKDHDITFDGDISQDIDFPETLRNRGYAIGPNAKGGAPGFAHPEARRPDLSVSNGSSAFEKSIAWTLCLPNGRKFCLPAGLNVGAQQTADIYKKLDSCFQFLPESTGFSDCPESSECQQTEAQKPEKPHLLLF